MNKKKLMIISIICMLVGFAAVSTVLFINGGIKISTNVNDFDVVFTKTILDGTDISEIAISTDGKTISFTSNKNLI